MSKRMGRPFKFFVKIDKVEVVPQIIFECIDLERHWLGYGYYGSRGVNQIARFIMVRNPLTLMTKYYFWSGKRRGEELSVVRQFQLRKIVTPEFVQDHYESNTVSRGLFARHGLTRSSLD